MTFVEYYFSNHAIKTSEININISRQFELIDYCQGSSDKNLPFRKKQSVFRWLIDDVMSDSWRKFYIFDHFTDNLRERKKSKDDENFTVDIYNIGCSRHTEKDLSFRTLIKNMLEIDEKACIFFLSFMIGLKIRQCRPNILMFLNVLSNTKHALCSLHNRSTETMVCRKKNRKTF